MKLLLGLFFFFSSSAFSATQYGVFVVVKGKVRIEGAGEPVDAKVNSKIQVGETVVTEADSRAKIVMLDRNIINVSPNTKLKIEKYTNADNDKNVNLKLIEGKVRNNVEQKYDNKNSKFEVRTATAVAGVRGTQFITSYDKQNKVTEVITLKGQVTFQTFVAGNETQISEPVVVEKGEKSQGKEGAPPAEPVKVPEKEIKQVDSETSVKKDPPAAGNPPPPPPNRGDTGNLPPPPRDPLKDLNQGNEQVKKGPAERKFDKSKVRIIPQPGS